MPSKITTPIIIRLENDIIAQLDTLAAQQSISRSAITRSALAAGLEALQRPVQQEPRVVRKIGRRSAKAKPQDQQQTDTLSLASIEEVLPSTAPASLVAPAVTSKAKRKAPRAKRAAAGDPLTPEFDLAAFAVQVLEAAKRTKTAGRFGNDRVFINHVWRQFKREQHPKGMDLEAFKQRLVEANRRRYLSLACADMAPIHDQADVKESEIHYRSATFHFVCI